MPMYEYQCISCSIRIETERSVHDERQPLCCGFAMRQIYSPIGAIFKGTGWGKDVK
jgi:putative FmdB family regulatory protein